MTRVEKMNSQTWKNTNANTQAAGTHATVVAVCCSMIKLNMLQCVGMWYCGLRDLVHTKTSKSLELNLKVTVYLWTQTSRQ